jgi:glycosyltransferase involved in cell wall biosynthesis
MKIIHVIPSVDPASGGPAEALKQLCQICKSGGHEVDVASLDSPESIAQLDFPANVYALGPGRGVYGYSSRAAKWLEQNIKRYQLVIIHGIWQYNTLAVYRALRKTRKPYAVFAHGMLDPYFKKQFPLKHMKKTVYWHLILQRILRNANAVLFTCDEEKILARQSFSRYRAREMVIPFGIAAPQFEARDAVEEFVTRWPELRGKRLAVSMGRIHAKKGTDILIAAFAKTLANDPQWHLVIAGPDEAGLQSELQKLSKRLGVSDRITWTGMLQGTAKWGALAASEVFVLPSHQENFGIVIAEALACNLPVVISNKVNIWREVADHGAGIVCGDTVDGTAKAFVRWQALSAEEIAEFRARSRECFDALFNYHRTANRVLEIVEDLSQQSGLT